MNYFEIPTSTPADLMAYVGGIFSDVWIIVALAIGVPLAFYVIKKVIALVPKR